MHEGRRGADGFALDGWSSHSARSAGPGRLSHGSRSTYASISTSTK
jgi:hypothetical protein